MDEKTKLKAGDFIYLCSLGIVQEVTEDQFEGDEWDYLNDENGAERFATEYEIKQYKLKR